MTPPLSINYEYCERNKKGKDLILSKINLLSFIPLKLESASSLTGCRGTPVLYIED